MKKLILIILALALIVGGCSTPKKEELPNDNIVEEENQEPADEVETSKEDEEPTVIEAPDFTLKNLAGEEVSLSDYRGKIVLINFWATWCMWCDKEMPDLQRIQDENEDLVVLAVDVMEKEDEVKKYIEKGKYTFEVVLDEEGEIAQTYLVSGFPTSYFVDEEGILLGGVPRMMTYDEINDILKSIREEK